MDDQGDKINDATLFLVTSMSEIVITEELSCRANRGERNT